MPKRGSHKVQHPPSSCEDTWNVAGARTGEPDRYSLGEGHFLDVWCQVGEKVFPKIEVEDIFRRLDKEVIDRYNFRSHIRALKDGNMWKVSREIEDEEYESAAMNTLLNYLETKFSSVAVAVAEKSCDEDLRSDFDSILEEWMKFCESAKASIDKLVGETDRRLKYLETILGGAGHYTQFKFELTDMKEPKWESGNLSPETKDLSFFILRLCDWCKKYNKRRKVTNRRWVISIVDGQARPQAERQRVGLSTIPE